MFTAKKLKEMFDLLKDEIHCSCYFTCRDKKKFFLKTAQNPFPRVKFLFHKDTLIEGQAILDIAYKKCV